MAVSCNGPRSFPPPLSQSRPGQTALFSPSKERLQSGPEESRARQQARRSGPLTPRTALRGSRRERRARQILGRNPVRSPVKIAVRYSIARTATEVVVSIHCLTATKVNLRFGSCWNGMLSASSPVLRCEERTLRRPEVVSRKFSIREFVLACLLGSQSQGYTPTFSPQFVDGVATSASPQLAVVWRVAPLSVCLPIPAWWARPAPPNGSLGPFLPVSGPIW
jgi:hypothetical protein